MAYDGYETVAASQTAQVIGGSGSIKDVISHIVVVPASTSPGAITLIDGSTSITVFAGGTSSLTSLAPFTLFLNMKAQTGPWKLTTGANVSCIAVGDFA